MSDNHVNDVSDTVLAAVAADRWFELYDSVFEEHFDIKDRGEIVLLIILDVNLLGKVSHGGVDSLSDSFDDVSIDVAEVSWPLKLLGHLVLLGSNVIVQVLDKPVDLFTFSFDGVEASSH